MKNTHEQESERAERKAKLETQVLEQASGASTDTGNSFRSIDPTPNIISPVPNFRSR